MVQRLRICFAMQGTAVQSLVRKIPHAEQLSFTPQLLKPTGPKATAREAQAPQRDKACAQQEGPRTAKNKQIFKWFLKEDVEGGSEKLICHKKCRYSDVN